MDTGRKLRTLALVASAAIVLYGTTKFVKDHVEWRKERASKREQKLRDEWYRSKVWN